MPDKDELLGYCGLYCGNCLYFQNTAAGTGTTMDDGSRVDCGGCNSGNTSPWCTDCGIKKCCRNKGLRYCLLCADFPCGMMEQFINDPQYPYHKDVPGMMKRLEEIGLNNWSEEMAAKYTCGRCGTRFTYFDKVCPVCSDKNSKSSVPF